jgi:membrane protein required for colicin V production
MASAFDMGGIFLIAIFAYSGFRQGLIQGAMKLIGAAVAVHATLNYSQTTLALIKPIWEPPGQYGAIVGFVITFVGVLLAFNLVAWFIKRIFQNLHLGMVDKLGGVTFGAVKAGLILSAFVWAFMLLPPDMRGSWQQESQLYPVVDVFQAKILSIFGFEDDLAMLQETITNMVANPGAGMSDAMMEKMMKMLPEDQREMLAQIMELSEGGGDPAELQAKLMEMGGDNPVLQQFMQQMETSTGGDAYEDALKMLEQ